MYLFICFFFFFSENNNIKWADQRPSESIAGRSATKSTRISRCHCNRRKNSFVSSSTPQHDGGPRGIRIRNECNKADVALCSNHRGRGTTSWRWTRPTSVWRWTRVSCSQRRVDHNAIGRWHVEEDQIIRRRILFPASLHSILTCTRHTTLGKWCLFNATKSWKACSLLSGRPTSKFGASWSLRTLRDTVRGKTSGSFDARIWKTAKRNACSRPLFNKISRQQSLYLFLSWCIYCIYLKSTTRI